MIINSKFREVYKEDLKFGEGSTTVQNNDDGTSTVHEINATHIPVVDEDLKELGADVEEILKALNNIDVAGKLDAVGETRDIKTAGDMEASSAVYEKVSVTEELDVNNTIIKNVTNGVDPTDGVNKSQLDEVASNINLDHNDLNGLNEGDFQHLSAIEKTALTNGQATDLHSHDVNYNDLSNKLTSGTGITIENNVVSNSKITENNVVSKLVQYSVGSEAADPEIGEMTMSVLSDGSFKVKIYPEIDGLIYDRKRESIIRFRSENGDNGIVEMYIYDDCIKTNNIYSYIAYSTFYSATTNMVDLAGLQESFSLMFDNNMSNFTKNTAYNKNFGTTAGTVSEGNHTHELLYAKTSDGLLQETVSKGDLLYISGFADNKKQVSKADVLSSGKFPATFVALEGGFGGDTIKMDSKVDVEGYNTNTTAVNDIVYLGINGGWTTTKPSCNAQVIGYIMRVGYTDGEIYFNIDSPIDTCFLDQYYDEQAIDEMLLLKEDSFIKNTAFNKNFGTTADTVAEGNHDHGIEYIHSTNGSLISPFTNAWDYQASGSVNTAVPVNTFTGDITLGTLPGGGASGKVIKCYTENTSSFYFVNGLSITIYYSIGGSSSGIIPVGGTLTLNGSFELFSNGADWFLTA